MPLSDRAAIEQTREMLKVRAAEHEELDLMHDYLRGRQPLPVVPGGVPQEVRRLAKMSRVNILDLVISSVAQSLYVDGYRQERAAEDAPAWDIWQANRMDARQIAVHRSALAYGVSYMIVLPGDPVPVLKGYSPRRMTTLYGDDEEWPMWGLLAEHSGGRWHYRLYDQTSIYFVGGGSSISEDLQFLERRDHGIGVVPIVRFINQQDLDEELRGEVEPLMPIQDQIDLTTFELLVAQHYAAFRQRWIIGWTAAEENDRLKASASRLWTFDDSPEDVKVGEFEQTDLKGYLDSREASLRHAASLSQTPAHELMGQMINLSAEALVAAEASQQRKIAEREQSFGESHEQVLALAGQIAGLDVSESAQVRWRDTESRALAATVDALGKMAQMLGVPVQMLWERIPGVTQQDVERWQAAFEEGDALASLTRVLDEQMGGVGAGEAA